MATSSRSVQVHGRSVNSWWWLAAVLAAVLAAALPLPAQAPTPAVNQCLECHTVMGFDGEAFAEDIHAQRGLNCASCHGGDATSDDYERAHSKAAGFRGAPARTAIPQACAACHSDGAYMRRFNPSLRTDQLSLYRTSEHGRRLALGDENVAVCTDCHGVHGMRPGRDTRSSVHPLNVATTCAQCHSSAELMQPYKIPTDQYELYKGSVHHHALAVRGDLSAPTCSTCHGNHGAAPPGVASVEFVCANCHVFQAQLFDVSPHKQAFEAVSLPSCVTCHSNHRIDPPSDAMIGTGPQAVCTNCHVEGDGGWQAAEHISAQLARLVHAIALSEQVLQRAERSGMEVSEAKLQQAAARDALTKARVTLHSVTPARVDEDIAEGLQVAAATLQAGHEALEERDFRRKGLGVSLLAILLMVLALALYVRQIEQRAKGRHTGP
jgi:hypothetical protein